MSVHVCESDPRSTPYSRLTYDDVRSARADVVALLQPRPRLPVEIERLDNIDGVKMSTSATIDVDGVISAMTIMRGKRLFGVQTLATFVALLDRNGNVIWRFDGGPCEVAGRWDPRATSRRERAFFAPVAPTLLSRAHYIAIVHDAAGANIDYRLRENAIYLNRARRARPTTRRERTTAR
jgi:hypothetical protein